MSVPCDRCETALQPPQINYLTAESAETASEEYRLCSFCCESIVFDNLLD